MDPELYIHYPMSAKLFLQKRGIDINTTTRTKIEKVSKEHKERLDDILTEFQNLTEKLLIKTIL